MTNAKKIVIIKSGIDDSDDFVLGLRIHNDLENLLSSSNEEIELSEIFLTRIEVGTKNGADDWQGNHWLAFDFQNVCHRTSANIGGLHTEDIVLILVNDPRSAFCIIGEFPPLLTCLPNIILIASSAMETSAWLRISEALIGLPEYFQHKIYLFFDGLNSPPPIINDARLRRFLKATGCSAQDSYDNIMKCCHTLIQESWGVLPAKSTVDSI